MEQEQLKTQILTTLGIENLSEEEQNEALSLALDVIIKQAVLLAHDALPEEKRAAFISLVEEGGDFNDLAGYFSQTVEGKSIFDKAIEEVLASLK